MVISHNIPALMTHLNMKKNDRLLTTAMQRMSTGVKINSAKDDAAGLAIANKLAYQVSGLNKASDNATNGISMIQTAEGALNEVHNMLQRMRELSVQVANGTLTDDDRSKVQTEINELVDEITATANRTEFNKIKLLNGEANRVSASYYQGKMDKVVATALYISDNIPAGTLKYTVAQPGMPAQTTGTTSRASAEGLAALFDGTLVGPTADDDLQDYITNNGTPTSSTPAYTMRITFTGADGIDRYADLDETDTIASAQSKLLIAANKADLAMTIGDDGAITLTSRGNGEGGFSVSGDLDLLEGLGMPADAAVYDAINNVYNYADPLILDPRLQPAVFVYKYDPASGASAPLTPSTALANVTYPYAGSMSIYGITVNFNLTTNIPPGTAQNDLKTQIEAVLGAGCVNADGTLDPKKINPTGGQTANIDLGVVFDSNAKAAAQALGMIQMGTIANTNITINGMQISFSADDTYVTAMEKIENICSAAGIQIAVDPNTGEVTLTTYKEGGKEYITVEGDNRVLNLLGMKKGSTNNLSATDITNGSQPGKGSGSVTINGYRIEVSDTDSPAQVKNRIIEYCNYAGIIYQEKPNGTVYLTSAIAGSNQAIHIGGDPEFLKYFGLAPTVDANGDPDPAKGTDAIISVKMYDEAGKPIDNFNNGMSYVADGNQITISGTGGQVIKLNLQVMINYQDMPPTFTYGDGITPVVDTNGDFIPMDMDLVIKDYGPIMLQIGQSYNMAMSVQIPKLTSETLGFVEYKGGRMYRLLNIQTQDAAGLAIDKVDEAITTVSTVRSRLGAYQNRLESTISSLDTASENTESARSRIQDTDMAEEMTNYSKRNVMYQAGLSMLAQANQRPQQILSLLQ